MQITPGVIGKITPGPFFYHRANFELSKLAPFVEILISDAEITTGVVILGARITTVPLFYTGRQEDVFLKFWICILSVVRSIGVPIGGAGEANLCVSYIDINIRKFNTN